MSPSRRERLILTLPSDPGMARLARLATLHFLRQNGVGVREARKGAKTVEKRCRAKLRAAHPTAKALVLVLTAGAVALDATGRSRPGFQESRLLHLNRPDPS